MAKLFDQHLGAWLVARLGGEEFAVLLDDIDLPEARHHLEAFRHAVEHAPLHCGEAIISITVSIGLTDQLWESMDNMIKAADLALYQAMESGRNRVVG